MIDLRNKVLPSSVDVGGRTFFIDTDYRRWLDFGAELESKHITYEYLISFIIDDEVPPVNMAIELLEKLIEFYSKKSVTPHDIPESSIKSLDYILDGEYIYASVLHYYNIDLIDIDHLHWYKFRAMIDCIKDSKINDIISNRTWERPPRKYSSEHDNNQREKIKKYWSLPSIYSEEDRKAKERFDEIFG